jgi:hypothetical protein
VANLRHHDIPRQLFLEWQVGQHVRHKLPYHQRSMAWAGIRLGFGQHHQDIEHLGGRNGVNQGSCGVLSHCQDDPESQSFVVLEMR